MKLYRRSASAARRRCYADWNHHPLLGHVARLRFKLVVSLLAGERVGRLLEIGYGSGVFMPELSRYCEELYGVDVHSSAQKVAKILAGFDVRTELVSGSATAMPFEIIFSTARLQSARSNYLHLDAAASR